MPSALRPAAVLLAATLLTRAAAAQAHPGLDWRTLHTDQVRVHFTPETEDLAYRTLANALWAYQALSRELPAPRGMIDIVVADNADFANGVATPYPSNRIVIYARPPVDEPALRNHADWNQLVVTHEMLHIFQLDRVDGWWKLAQRIFGRAAPLFPHTYAPNWLLEGAAVHYETRLTGAGRLAGAEFPAAVRALAQERRLPTLDGIVAPRPFYPAGGTPYLLGAMLVDRAAHSRPGVSPDSAMAALFTRMSRRINPWRIDRSAREAFGSSFTAMYAAWRDSLQSADPWPGDTATVTRVPAGWTAAFPRYAADGPLRYVADNARQTPALCGVTDSGRCRRFGRRNSVDANTLLDDGAVVAAELDLTDPYTYRSELTWQRGRRHRWLSEGQRLAHPDADAATGRLVAVRTRVGTTDLVLLSVDDPYGRPLVEGTAHANWTEPRWSHDGTRIAAVRWEAGGRTAVVVLDTLGRELQRFAPRATDRRDRLALVSAPSWMPGDSAIVFASDHDGIPMVYRGDLRSGGYAPLWRTATALRHPSVSPDGRELAAVELRAGGWAVVTRTVPPLPPLADGPPAIDRESWPPAPPTAMPTNPSLEPFRPSDTAHPMWWLPAVEAVGDGGLRIGAMSGGRDVVGRHSWSATFMRDVQRPEWTRRIGYDYAGLGNPILSLYWMDDWDHIGIVNRQGGSVGTLSQHDATLGVSAYLPRPRVRLTTYALVSTELAFRSYQTQPENLLPLLNSPELEDTDLFPRLGVALGFSTLQRPGLSVSTEDGVAASVFVRRRFAEGREGSATLEGIAEVSVAKSLPLPGFARHVVALRAARGATGSNSSNLFEVGGVSGGVLPLLPGVVIGDARRTFFVRGFEPATQIGPHAAVLSAEYRAPLVRVSRGVGLVPASLQKLSVLGFADAGSSWCDVVIETSTFCSSSRAPRGWIGSVGGELAFDTALQYDVLYRMRLGLAKPVRGEAAASRGATVYFTFGSTF